MVSICLDYSKRCYGFLNHKFNCEMVRFIHMFLIVTRDVLIS